MTTTPAAPDEAVDLIELFDQLAKTNAASGGPPVRIAAGTFAIYPAEGGSIVLVFNVTEAPAPELIRTHRKRIGPAMIRTLQALGDGTGGLSTLKGMLPKRKQRGE